MMSGRDVGGDVPSEMTAILREAAAAVDVKRTLRTANAYVAIGREAGVPRRQA